MTGNSTLETGIRSLVSRIRRREQLLGLIVKMPNPALVEVAGHLGYDFVLLDTEHGSGDTLEIEHHLRAADSAGIDVIVRVGANDQLQVLRALDSGAKGVIAPHVDTPDAAMAAVSAAHYPPVGTRGLAASTRAGRHSTGTLADHVDRARRETTVIVQIEDKKAVQHAAAIAATEYVDAVWLGPGDLSMSFGHPGDLTHPDVAAAIDSIVDDVTRTENTALCVVVDSEDDIPYWRHRGASILVFVASNILMARFRELLKNARADAAN
jgi:4-hydroxy-2-oxoheptanedioate aldolase